MRLIFDRAQQLLVALTDDGVIMRQWPASNNAARSSRGPWPTGTFPARNLIQVGGPEGDPSGAFGEHFLLFSVPDRSGMGIHAGRDGRADLKGRLDWEHATMGCIRSTPEAMEELAALVKEHGLPELQVIEGGTV